VAGCDFVIRNKRGVVVCTGSGIVRVNQTTWSMMRYMVYGRGQQQRIFPTCDCGLKEIP